MYTKKTNLIIYETNDYGKFKFKEGNRSISKNSELENMIVSDDQLQYNPLIVDPDFYILDGQHRLSIAEKLGKPVYYLVNNSASEETIQHLNVGNRNWTQKNHIDFFAHKGKKNYKFLKEIVEKRPYLSISSFLDVFSTKSHRATKEMRAGRMEFKYNEIEILLILDRWDEIRNKKREICHSARVSNNAQRAIFRLICRPEYDHARFLHAIDLYPVEFIAALKQASTLDINAKILDVYNRNLKKNKLKL